MQWIASYVERWQEVKEAMQDRWDKITKGLTYALWQRVVTTFGYGGVCPWCASVEYIGRRGVQFRYCQLCDVTFNKTCSVCRHHGHSLGFSRRYGEYGCDRCGHRFNENHEIVLSDAKRTMWLTASGVYYQIFVSRLTLVMAILAFVGLLAAIILN